MKILLFFLLSISVATANHIFWLGDYDKALKKAHNDKKPMMVLVVKKDCKRCHKVIVKHFMNRDYIDELNKKYISVIVTYEGKLSYPIELFYSTTFPTLFFIDSQDESFLREPIYY
jgi:thioredoxin-related protein